MKKPELDKAIESVIALKMEAVDIIVKDVIKPLKVTDNPEELIGKPYEYWTPQDLELLKRVYGTAEPSTLSNFIFKKTYERVKELESLEI